MIHYPRYYLLLLVFVGYSGVAVADFVTQDLWQCTTQDGSKKHWSAQNSYQKLAFNKAMDLCKKESSQPESCKGVVVQCTHLATVFRKKSAWRCTALDMNAEAWRSNDHPGRDEAAFAAQGYCRHKSLVPDTCYINMVTCVDKGGNR